MVPFDELWKGTLGDGSFAKIGLVLLKLQLVKAVDTIRLCRPHPPHFNVRHVNMKLKKPLQLTTDKLGHSNAGVRCYRGHLNCH